ncbi:MAG: S9 family peptidase [Bacteroidales bacterium]
MKQVITNFFPVILALLFLSITACDADKEKEEKKKEKPEKEVSVSTSVMTPELLWKLGRVSDIRLSPDQEKVLFGISRYDLEKNSGQKDLFVMEIGSGEMHKLTSSEEQSESNGRWRPDGKKIGFLYPGEDNTMQLWEMNPDGSEKTQVSNVEGGINGFKYSPLQNYVLYTKDVKLDQTINEKHPDLPEANAYIAHDLMYRHWDTWHDYRYSHVFFARYDTEANSLSEHLDIMEGEPYDSPLSPWGGMEQIIWSPDEKNIIYVCKKLTGKEYSLSTNSNLYRYDLENKNTVNLTRDGFEGYDKNPVYSPDGKMLAWQSMETDGYESDKTRIMVRNMETGDIQNMSKDFDQNASNLTWNAEGSKLYFISGIHATYQLYELDMASEEFRQITEGKHNYVTLALAENQLIASKQSMAMPTEIFSVGMDGKETQLSRVNDDLLNEITLAHSEERWIETSDGEKMLVWVIYPPNFDKSKTYPALLYCQGGPQSAVSQFFSYRWNFQMMAAHDYIIVAPNRRGVPTFGQEWNEQISGDYGGQNIRDYMTAINTIAEEPFVDEDKLGAIGASYGGYSVYYLAGNHSDRFECFISHCGMFNLESMYASTDEYWFVNHDLGGPFWQEPKPKSYTEFSPHLYVDNWDTPIMMITAANDFRIPYTESLQAFNTAQLKGVPSKLLFFPEESHFVLKPQNSVLWHREFYSWLDKYLKE